MPATMAEATAKMDAVHVDLKSFTDDFCVRFCGAHLPPVLDTLVHRKHEAATPSCP